VTNHASKRRRRRAAGLATVAFCLLMSLPLLSAEAAPGTGGKLDLNRATLENLLALPIPEQTARDIHHYRTYVRFFDDIYDLMEVPGMTAALLERLKPLCAVMPPDPADASIARLSASYRQVSNFLGQEGSNEGLVDEYLDQLRDPSNVNELDLFDLMSFQNVSPIDATNIIKSRDRLGAFENDRQLRQAQGLSYWAYRNLRDYVVYSEDERLAGRPDRVRGSYMVRTTTQISYAGVDEDTEVSLSRDEDFLYNRNFWVDPALTHKLRLDLTDGVKAGLLTSRWVGDSYRNDNAWKDTVKGFYGVEDKDVGPFHLKRLVLGNYRVAFGLGLVMDNTDFTLYRKTGYGWNKRPIGVRPDLSRSREYALTGAAVEGRIGNLYATFFASDGEKDGILNEDGTVNQYITMIPRLSDEFLDLYAPSIRREAFEERLVGGSLKYMLAPGTFVGIHGYEASYDRSFRADIDTTLVPSENQDLLEARDSEIWTGYTSAWADPATGGLREYKFRTVMGSEMQAVYENFAVQGEYAWLQDPRRSLMHGNNPDAYIINAYTQFDDLYLLAIYRDYDLGFDNPYNRAFSNDSRYEQTLLDSPYRLDNEWLSFLSSNTPQPKPEKGLFFDARYRISRNLILTGLQVDQWERKADGADLRRYTIKAEYQPIFNLRLRVRHRYSSRTEQMPSDVRTFQNWETRWQLIAMLSNYNRLEFGFLTSNVKFPPRPRLSGTDEPGDVDSGLGLAADPANAMWVKYDHHLTPWLTLTAFTTIYDGFFWNFEGNEFVLLDRGGFRNYFEVESRLSEQLLFQLKVTHDHKPTRTYVDVRDFGAPLGPEPEATYVPEDHTWYRLQIDYTF
jgi:DNA uptake protein ComE-like DNA-binding protein